MFRVSSGGYAYLVLAALFIGPILWVVSDASILSISLSALIIYSVSMTMYFCHLENMNLARALGALSGRFSSGCANITILYIWVVVLGYLLVAFYCTAIGMYRGRTHSRERWIRFLNSQFP